MKKLTLFLILALTALSSWATNNVSSVPYSFTGTMASSFHNTTGALPNTGPITISQVYWTAPANAGDTLTLVDGSNNTIFTFTATAATVSQGYLLFQFSPSKVVSDFKVTALSSGTLYLYTGSSSYSMGTGSATTTFPGAPTGSCSASQTAVDTSTGNFYSCDGGVWQFIGPGANLSFAQVLSLWTSCTSGYLAADGTCGYPTANQLGTAPNNTPIVAGLQTDGSSTCSWKVNTSNQVEWNCPLKVTSTGGASNLPTTTNSSPTAGDYWNNGTVFDFYNGTVTQNTVTPLSSATAHQWVQYTDASGAQHLAQPAVGDITGAQPYGTLTNGDYCTYVTGTGIVCNSTGSGSMTYPAGNGIPVVSAGASWGTTLTKYGAQTGIATSADPGVTANVPMVSDGTHGIQPHASGALGTGAFAAAYSLPAATSSTLGGVKPDGTSILNTSGAISATATSIGLGSVTNDAQTKAAVVPNTAPTAGQDLVGNAGGTAYAPVTMSGDCTRASTGAITCTKTNGVAFASTATSGTATAVATNSDSTITRIAAAEYAIGDGTPGDKNGVLDLLHLHIYSGTTIVDDMDNGGLDFASGQVLGWTASTTDATAGIDTGLSRSAAGTISVDTSTPGNGLGAVVAAKFNKVAITAPATGSTLTIADGKTLTASNTITLAGADSTSFNVSNGKTRQCEVVWGGTGTSNVLQSGDDVIANNSCFNKTGATWTITALYCMADVASNTVTLNPTFGSAGTGTTILSGALTCGSSYAYSTTGTVANATMADGNGIDPAMSGTLNAHSVHMLVVYTLP